MIEKIISGGQTGADQAGLDVAIELGIWAGVLIKCLEATNSENKKGPILLILTPKRAI